MQNNADRSQVCAIAPLPLNPATIAQIFQSDRETAQSLLPMLVVNPIEYIAYPDSRYQRRIPVRQILAEPWHQRRLADCRAKLQQNTKPPPVQAFGYELANRLWYILQDGTHRTVAAREAGKRTIASICRGYSKCTPEYFRLYHSAEADRWSLLRIEEWNPCGVVWVTQTQQWNLLPEITNLACKIGIPQIKELVGFQVSVTPFASQSF